MITSNLKVCLKIKADDNFFLTDLKLLFIRKLKEQRKKHQQENVKRKEKEKALNKYAIMKCYFLCQW